MALFKNFLKKKKKGEKPLLIPTFSGDSHFSPYILFFPLLVHILKKSSRFGPCHLGVSMFDPTREHDTNPTRVFSG